MIRRVSIWLVPPCLILSACVPWTVRPLESETSAATSSAALTPARYVDAMWDSKLLPAILNSAVDARTLVDALKTSPGDALSRYGHQEANGPAYFQVKGEGVVTSVDTRSRVGLALVDIPPLDHQPDVSIQIGPVLRGTALRDATGLVRFTDFVNQLQFADVANELNDRVLKTVLSPVGRAALKGKTVTFVGAVAAEPDAAPPLREVMPIRFKVENVE
jgi:predicted lipoprotein